MAKEAFRKDSKLFSLEEGTHPLIARARATLRVVPGAEELLFRLLCLDPAARPSPEEVLELDYFQKLRVYTKDN